MFGNNSDYDGDKGKNILPPSMRISYYLAEKIVDCITMISSMEEKEHDDDYYEQFSIIVKSMLHNMVEMVLSMEIGIHHLLLQLSDVGGCSEDTKNTNTSSSTSTLADKITKQLLMDNLTSSNSNIRSVGFNVLQNTIEISVAVLHRQGGNSDLLLQFLLLSSSVSDPNKGKSNHKQEKGTMAVATASSSGTTTTTTTTSFSLFDLLDKNPHLYNNNNICDSVDNILKSYNNYKHLNERGVNTIETWLEETLQELEKVQFGDHSLLSHTEWETLQEILRIGLGSFTLLQPRDKNNSTSSITKISTRFLQLHRDIIQSIFNSGTIEEGTATNKICDLLHNLLLTLHDIFYSCKNPKFLLTKEGQTSFALTTPLQEFVGQLVLTSYYVAKDILLPICSPLSYIISSDTQQKIEDITILLFSLFCVGNSNSTSSCWAADNNGHFILLPSHLFASVDPYASLFDLWIRQFPPQKAWMYVTTTNLRDILFKCCSSKNHQTKIKMLRQKSNTLPTHRCHDRPSPLSACKANITMSIDNSNSNTGEYKNFLSSPLAGSSKTSIDIIDMGNALYIWSLCAVRSLICTFRRSVFMDSTGNIVTEDVITILQTYLSVLKVGVTTDEYKLEGNLTQLCSDVLKTALNIFRPDQNNSNCIIYDFITKELTCILLKSQDSFTLSNPFVHLCLCLLCDIFDERSPLIIRHQNNTNDHHKIILSWVVEVCHNYLVLQWTEICSRNQNNGSTCLSTERNILDDWNKMKSLICIVSLVGDAIYWSGSIDILENPLHSAILTSLDTFVKCSSYMGLRREAFVTLAVSFCRTQYGGIATLLEQLDYTKECVEYVLVELFLLLSVARNHDRFMERKQDVFKLLRALINVCQGTKYGGVLLIKDVWFQRLFPLIVSSPHFDDNKQTKFICLLCPAMMLEFLFDFALGSCYSNKLFECSETIDMIELQTRNFILSGSNDVAMPKGIFSVARCNFNLFFATLHHYRKSVADQSDNSVREEIFISAATLLLSQFIAKIVGTSDTKEIFDRIIMEMTPQESIGSFNYLSLAEDFIRIIELTGTTAAPRDVCFRFSSLMTADVLKSVNLLPPRQAVLFASRIYEKSLQTNLQYTSRLKDCYITIMVVVKGVFQLCKMDFVAPHDIEKGMHLFLGFSKDHEIFVDWFGISIYVLCHGNVDNAYFAMQILKDKPGIQLLWPRIRLETGCITCLVSFLSEEILRVECPEVLAALEQCGCPLSSFLSVWHRQCFLGVLSFGDALLLQCISLLHGVDYIVYYAICIILHSKTFILTAAAQSDLLKLSSFSTSEFCVATSFECAKKLCGKYREVIFCLHDEIKTFIS